MANKSMTKDVPRAQLEEDVEAYLKRGGKIEQVESGVSGIKPKQSPAKKAKK